VSWFVFVDGNFIEVDERPYNLQWDIKGMRLAFSTQEPEPKVGIINGGWSGNNLAIYRDGKICLVSPWVSIQFHPVITEGYAKKVY